MFSDCQWIWCGEEHPDAYRDFQIPLAVRPQRVYRLDISCDTDYALYDGERLLAFGQYADYMGYKVYDSVELDCPVGECLLILRVWHQGLDTLTQTAKPAGVLFCVTEDGVPVVRSGGHILGRVSAGYVQRNERWITSQLGYSFAYDAGRPAGTFAPAHPVEGFSPDLVLRPVEKLELHAPLAAKRVQTGEYTLCGGDTFGQKMQRARLSLHGFEKNWESAVSAGAQADGVYALFDLGREAAGFLSLDVTVEEPCEILVGWGEHLLDGRVRTAIHDRDFTCLYRAVPGRNRFLHPFRRLGGRYLQVFLATKRAELSTVSLCETRYPVQARRLEKGDCLRRRIYDVCVNTLVQCIHEHYEDCPWREQALYTLDSRNQMLCGYAVFGETRFARANLELISHGLRPDGLLSLCYPAGTDCCIPVFSLVYFLQMREYGEYSGDWEFVAEKYGFLQSLLAVFSRRAEQGLVPRFADGQWNFYEWAERLSGDAPGRLQAPLNGFYSLALNSMAAIAQALHKPADADRYRRMASETNTALARTFYRSDSGLFASFAEPAEETYSVLTNSLCILCGATEGLDKSAILKILLANGAAGTGLSVTPTTLSMNSFRYDALLQENRERFRDTVLEDIDETYLSMLCMGATSFWETAVGADDFGGAGSLCHGWSAMPAYYYMRLL